MKCSRVVVACAVGGALAVVPAFAQAALPTKQGRYVGSVTGGGEVELRMTRNPRRQDFFEIFTRTSCPKLGRVEISGLDVRVGVSAGGSFARTDLDVRTMDLGRVFDSGVTRDLFDVSRTEMRGRFTSARRATGTWRSRSVVLDERTFLTDDGAFDRCDTGELGWTAKRR